QWRIHADVALRHVELVRADDAVAKLRAVVAFERDPRTEEYASRIRGRLVDHHHAFQPLAQVPDARVDFTQAPLAIDVIGILGTITERGRRTDRGSHLRSFDAPQLRQFGLHARMPRRRDVAGAGYRRRAVATHLQCAIVDLCARAQRRLRGGNSLSME